ncbi:MAG: NAD(P)H-dependent oxidoreductase [Desulfopila sp.]|jgi:NAD(P)H dehydrogenase (quinone)|nr:NAD(P)H-dependent oxidoreductase [Desulfopila sp.]
MNVFIVYYHPEPHSFNSAMLQKAVEVFQSKGDAVQVSDLHQSDFSPVSGRHNFKSEQNSSFYKQQFEELHATETNSFAEEIEDEISKVEWCDLMIWQFPLWWAGLPAPLKGWVDRVFAMGRTYGNGRCYENGVFQKKKAMLSLTTGGPQQSYLEDGFNGDIHSILRPIHRGILQFVGFRILFPHIVFGPAHLTDEERTLLLGQYGNRLAGIEKENTIAVGKYR